VELTYRLKIENPSQHLLKVRIEGKRPKGQNRLLFYLPRWCQGSYQAKNYDPFIRTFVAQNKQGEYLYFEKIMDAQFEIDWNKSELKGDDQSFLISYQIYCHSQELDFSSIDESHAYLFGANCFMGVAKAKLKNLQVFIEFPPLWSRINTSLEDISEKMDTFIYLAKDYRELISTPFEIGCHETDGMRLEGIDHYFSQVGDLFPSENDIKKDLIKVCGEVKKIFPKISFPKINIINNFNMGAFDGIGLLNTTVLNIHGIKFADKKYYQKFLYKFCQSYLQVYLNQQTPEDINKEEYYREIHSKLLWPIEGLASFLPSVILFKSGLIEETTFTLTLQSFIFAYLSNNGKKFQTLEESSQNLWTRKRFLSEDFNNFSVPLSLKGSIVFFYLSVALFEKGSSLTEFIGKMTSKSILKEKDLYNLLDTSIRDRFELLVSTTEDIDIAMLTSKIGLKYITHEFRNNAWPGMTGSFIGERVFIKSVALDGPCYKGGLNIGDEILAINGNRVLKNTFNELSKFLMVDKYYQFLIRRNEKIMEADILIENSPINFVGLQIEDDKLLKKYLKGI